jgi:hypothetical protein
MNGSVERLSETHIADGRNYQNFLLKLQLPFITLNPLTPNGHYSGRTAPLTSGSCILNIYSTNIRNEYFKHAA